jgi:hypothetical protein
VKRIHAPSGDRRNREECLAIGGPTAGAGTIGGTTVSADQACLAGSSPVSYAGHESSTISNAKTFSGRASRHQK